MREAALQLMSRAHVSADGDDLVLTYDVVSILAFSAIPFVAILIGVGCWRFARRLATRNTPDPQAALKVRIVACCAFAFAFGISVMLIPGVMHLEVRISDDRLVQSTGIWSTENVRVFPFDRIESIREDMQPGDFGPELVWLVQWRDGRAERFDPCDLIAANSEFIGDELRKRGVEFESLRQ